MSEHAPFYLFATGGEAKPAITLGQALPKTRNSLPCFYYWRQSIADGEYVHPVKKFGLKVDASRRRTWEQNFRRMKDCGEEVPIVEDHADAKSNATLGYVVDVRQNGKWYEELHQYLGEKERDTALRNKISIGIDPDFHTGNGVRLGDCIIHSATTPRPVVPGQGEAVPIAASRGPAGDVLELNCGTGAGGFHEGNTCAAGGGEGERFAAGETVSWTAGGKKFSGTVGKFVSAGEANTKPEETPLPPRTADTMSDAIAIASPSGRISQRAKDAATKRLGEKLFGGASLKGTDRTTQAERMRSTAANRRDMARLASPSQAKVILAEAEDLEAAASDPIGYYEVTDAKGKKRTVAHGRLVRSVSQSLSRSTPMTEAELTAIGEIIGADDVTDETAVPRLIDWGKQVKTDKATALSRVSDLEKERDAAKAQVLELSRTGNGPDPEVLHERSLRIMDKADSLSAAGILPPAFVDKFKKLLGGDKPRALLLSRDTGAADCPAGEFINLLAEFKPVMQFGEKTGAQQTLVLGRQAYGNPGDAGADEEAKKIDEFMKERQAQRKTA